jgi:hypothetical protein
MSKFEIEVTQEDIDESRTILRDGNLRMSPLINNCPIAVAFRRKGLLCSIGSYGAVLCKGFRRIALEDTGLAASFIDSYDSGKRVEPVKLKYRTNW